MKKVIFISAVFLFVMAESRGQRQVSNNDFITVNVTRSYSPKKELILQDLMDVEYVALETKDDFVNQGFVRAIGKEFILVTNYFQINDGNIFVYDRTGKALRKINRKGQGGEEYTGIAEIVLDESNDEIFVNDYTLKKILVYDLYGKFKRSFKHREGSGSRYYRDVSIYDRDNLICYDQFNEKTAFVLISKQDGSITKEINIPFKEKIFTHAIVARDATTGQEAVLTIGQYNAIIPHNGAWILSEFSTDTVHTFLPNHSLRPFIVRTPSIQSMNPGVFLMLRFISKRYYFMDAIRFDVNSRETRPIFFMYDTHEKAILGYNVYNGDFTTKKEVYMNFSRFVNHEIASWYPLEAFELVEPYKKGQLKGKLKEIAAGLDEEDNRVIMLLKHKK